MPVRAKNKPEKKKKNLPSLLMDAFCQKCCSSNPRVLPVGTGGLEESLKDVKKKGQVALRNQK